MVARNTMDEYEEVDEEELPGPGSYAFDDTGTHTRAPAYSLYRTARDASHNALGLHAPPGPA